MSVRYKDATGGGNDFESLPGMYWSSSAYYFYQKVNCPAMTNQDQSITGFQIDMGGPHFKSDGTTLNYGYVEVYIPTPALLSCFGGTPAMVSAALKITRTESGVTQNVDSNGNANAGLDYDLTATDAGLLIKFNKIAFSRPTYKITTKRTSGSTTTTNVNLARTTKTYDQLRTIVNTGVPLANQLPKFGPGYYVVTSQTTDKCRPGSGVGQGKKLFGLAAGTCRFTIKSYNAYGVLKGTKTGSFTVS